MQNLKGVVVRILHIADLHLGKKLVEFDRIDEQREVLEEIIDIADENDVSIVLVAGDIFDSFNPSAEANELLYRFLKRISKNGKRAVVAIAGNHDSADRIESPDPLAKECGIIFAGYAYLKRRDFELDSGLKVKFLEPGIMEVNIADYSYPARIIYFPYANEQRLKKYLGEHDKKEEGLRKEVSRIWNELANKYFNDNSVNLLVAHLFMTNLRFAVEILSENFMTNNKMNLEESDDEKSILHPGGLEMFSVDDLPKNADYIALGHLHKPVVLCEKPYVVYSGSPLPYSLSEKEQDKCVFVFEKSTEQVGSLKRIPLKKGKKIKSATFSSVSNALAWLEKNQDCYAELKIKTKNYLTGESIKQLKEAHPFIIAIVPLVENETVENSDYDIDLNADIKELFAKYFKHVEGVEPSKEIMDIFSEIETFEEKEE